MTTIKDFIPRNTCGTIPVSEDYLTEFAERIILECVRVMDEQGQGSELGNSIIENFELR